jgi:PX domain
MMFLEKHQWSKRFDSTFFSFTLDGKRQLLETPQIPAEMEGKTNHPATYFELTVYCEHRTISILRRYSHFRWLFHEINDSNSKRLDSITGGPPLRLPPGTCPFQRMDENFLQTRKDELRDFLNDLLNRPGNSQHPAVVTFLSLDQLIDCEGKSSET